MIEATEGSRRTSRRADAPARIWLAPSAFAPHVGGIEEATLRLALEFARRGHDVRVVTHRHPRSLPEHDEVDGVPVHRVLFPTPTASLQGAMRGARDLGAALTRLARTGARPDLVHVHGVSVQLPVLQAFTALRRVPLVVTTHGEVAADEYHIFDSSSYLRASLRTAARGRGVLTAVSADARASAVALAPGFGRAQLVPDGIDPAAWPVPPLTDDPVFAAWGRLEHNKGYDLLLTAFERVRAERPDAKLLVGGSGTQSAALRARAGAGVHFLGRLDPAGVRRLVGWARVVVVPSRCEAFGIVALEAMASGRTVVCSDTPGLRVAAGDLGRFVPVGDPAALATAMMAALGSPDDPLALRRHAEGFDWRRVADDYARLYADAGARGFGAGVRES